MNPSTSDWVQKHFSYFLEKTALLVPDEQASYLRFREGGFIYGVPLQTLTDIESEQVK